MVITSSSVQGWMNIIKILYCASFSGSPFYWITATTVSCKPYPCRKTWSRFSQSLWHWRSLFRRIRGLSSAAVWFLKNTAACICNIQMVIHWSNQIWFYTKWRVEWEVLPGKWQCPTLTSIFKRLLRNFLLHPQRPLKDNLLHPQSTAEGSSAQSSETPEGSYAPSSHSSRIFCFILKRSLKDHLLHPQRLLRDLLLSSRDSWSSEGSPALSSRDSWGIFCSILRDSWGICCSIHPQRLMRALLLELSSRGSWSSHCEGSPTLPSRDSWDSAPPSSDSWGLFCSTLKKLLRTLLLNPQTPEGSSAPPSRDTWGIFCSILRL